MIDNQIFWGIELGQIYLFYLMVYVPDLEDESRLYITSQTIDRRDKLD